MIVEFFKFISNFRSGLKIISILRALLSQNEILKLHRKENLFDEFNMIYGPLFDETLDWNYIFFTFTLFNLGKKALIQSSEVSLFDRGSQQWYPCELLIDSSTPLTYPYLALHSEIPKGHRLFGAMQEKELGETSASQFFLRARCKGFQTKNLENQALDWHTPCSQNIVFPIKFTIKLATDKEFEFKIKVWTADPAEISK